MNGTGITDLLYNVIRTSAAAQWPATAVALPGTPESVPIARQLVRDALPACPRADDLVLVVSELASNSLAHSSSGLSGMFTVRVRTAPRWARIEVTDDGPAPGSPTHRNGWGLAIVAAVTDRAGATLHRDGTRTAWAEVNWPPP